MRAFRERRDDSGVSRISGGLDDREMKPSARNRPPSPIPGLLGPGQAAVRDGASRVASSGKGAKEARGSRPRTSVMSSPRRTSASTSTGILGPPWYGSLSLAQRGRRLKAPALLSASVTRASVPADAARGFFRRRRRASEFPRTA
jgi:hypothetical protein